MIVYGLELLQIGCHLLTHAEWAAHWHYYVETTGHTCITNLTTTYTCPATMLTPAAGNHFPIAGFQEFPGLLRQSDQAAVHSYAL